MDAKRTFSATQALCTAGLVALLFVTASSTGAYASQPGDDLRTTRNVTADILFARPLGFVQLVVGVAMFPVAYPAGWIVGDSGFAARVCIQDPAARVFTRPLGEL